MQRESRLFIKGMVCHRCIAVVKAALKEAGIMATKINLGEVTMISNDLINDTIRIESKLRPLGFSLLEDKKVKMIREIKDMVAHVYSGHYDFPNHFRFSELIATHLYKEYDTISSLFSQLEHITLEKYIIEYRIQKVKEYLVYSSLSLADIAFRLNFSSVAHLSRQFKQQTGLTPSYFKEIKKEKIRVESNMN